MLPSFFCLYQIYFVCLSGKLICMNKQTFVECIDAIEAQYKYDAECAEAIGKVFTEPHSYMLQYDNHKIVNALVLALSESMDDDENWIEYYLWELDFGKRNADLKAYDAQGAEIPLSNAGELYDLLEGGRRA